MTRVLRITSAILAAYLAGEFVVPARAQTSEDRAAVERQIRQAIEAWRAAANRSDAAGQAKIWAAGVQGGFRLPLSLRTPPPLTVRWTATPFAALTQSPSMRFLSRTI